MRKGFTLIELLIVIAIIALLATLAIVSLTTAQQKARDTKRLADVKQLQNAIELFFSEDTTGQYPDPATWTALGTSLAPYITIMPIDPTNDGIYYYAYMVNQDTEGDEYYVGAKLENESHDALLGDDDTDQVVGGTWTNAPVISATVVATNGIAFGAAALDGFYCDDTLADGDPITEEGAYCLSE